ncbi:MAG TPA: Ig-like domain-containing protein, partial [Patescibacteria group bacterium]|nr:Ig-like domain-containing protein [Patescibacteria group bacterium]
IVFDRPIDPGSVDGDVMQITPDLAGTLEVVVLPGEDAGEPVTGRVLRFTPSGPLPPNTTFDVQVAPGVVAAAGGGGLAQPLSWSFTTGAPSATLSNQITFLSDRSGVANVWSMNPDGTGQHPVSAELAAILDYAVAPDGSSLIVADGRRLIFLRADGGDRRVITGGEHWEFDPTYAPSGRVVAFGRADATSGDGLGLWQWEVGAGDPQPIELPDETSAGPAPSASDEEAPLLLRAPRYSPDGLALAFVDASGSVGLLELPAQRLTRVPFAAAAPPAWLPDSSAVLLGGTPPDASGELAPLAAPVERLEPGAGDAVHRLARSGTSTRETALGTGWRVLAVAGEGTIAFATDRGGLGTTDDEDATDGPLLVEDALVIGAAFAPGEEAMVIVAADEGATVGSIVRLDLATGERTALATEGWLPRWLP